MGGSTTISVSCSFTSLGTASLGSWDGASQLHKVSQVVWFVLLFCTANWIARPDCVHSVLQKHCATSYPGISPFSLSSAFSVLQKEDVLCACRFQSLAGDSTDPNILLWLSPRQRKWFHLCPYADYLGVLTKVPVGMYLSPSRSQNSDQVLARQVSFTRPQKFFNDFGLQMDDPKGFY